MVDITLSFASKKCGEERDSVYAEGRRVSGYMGVIHLFARINCIIRAAPAACIITTVFLLWQIAPHVLSGRRELGGLRDDRQCAYTLDRNLAPCAAETTANFG
jgi:hypothetical protein